MLDAIGVDSIEELFDEIPAAAAQRGVWRACPPASREMEIARLMQQRAAQDGRRCASLGAGAYEHHIPAAVWEITTRGEFYTAYTPYQAEASQGTLQLHLRIPDHDGRAHRPWTSPTPRCTTAPRPWPKRC